MTFCQIIIITHLLDINIIIGIQIGGSAPLPPPTIWRISGQIEPNIKEIIQQEH